MVMCPFCRRWLFAESTALIMIHVHYSFKDFLLADPIQYMYGRLSVSTRDFTKCCRLNYIVYFVGGGDN